MKFILVGPPNSGKSTLYNWLTGSSAKVVNYPGSTVDYMSGFLASHWGDEKFEIIDSPGTYSLQPKSEDEEVTLKLLKEKKADAVVLVLDPTQLSRHLVLALQVQRLGYPMMIVLSMKDLLSRQNIRLQLSALEAQFQCPMYLIDGQLGGGLDALISGLKKVQTQASPPRVSDNTDLDQDIKQSQTLYEQVISSNSQQLEKVWGPTLKIDQIFLHPVLGYFSFFAIMFLLFTSVYWLATPLMDSVETLFMNLSELMFAKLPDSLVTQFLSDGIVTSFASVFVFVPQIFILFFLLSALEGSGYLARAATIIDRPFSLIGLSGRSFVPFLSGYACAVPALMATRNISSPKEKWIARMIIPLLSCSARLPVYGLLLGFLFWQEPAWKPGAILAFLYLFSMLLASLAAGILSRFVKSEKPSFLMMELPIYRSPRIKTLFLQAWNKTKSFITRAGPVIFVLSVFLWLGMNFPRHNPETQPEQTQLEVSYLGLAGQKMEPIFEPMGLDWRGGVGLIAAFAAREVFVSTLAVLYKTDEESGDLGLIEKLQTVKWADGRIIYTTSVMWGLIVFFMIALQCLSTVGVMVKESQSWKLATLQLVVYNGIAYALAVLIVQGLRAAGVA